MKKLFTVLAVLLVASVVFAAGFSGNVKAEYNFNFDEKTVKYGAPGFGAVDVTFGWDSPVLTVGEEEGTHIEMALSTGFLGYYNWSSDHYGPYDPFLPGAEAWTWSYNFPNHQELEDTIRAGISLSVDTFKIVAKDWEVSFIDNLGLDFAKSAIDSKKFNGKTLEENVQYYSMNNSVKAAHNLKATFFGYSVGFGIGTYTDKDDKAGTTTSWDKVFDFGLTATTPEYDFNGVKAQFGAGYQVINSKWAFAASAKASYAADKWSLSGAYDAQVAKNAADETFVKNDLAVKFDFAPVSVDVYFANAGASVKDKYADYIPVNDEGIDAKGNKHTDALDSNYLSAKVVVDVAKVAENVPVTVTLTGKNLLNEDKQIVSVSATTTIVPNFKFGAYFNDWFDFETDSKASNNNNQKLGATVEFTGVEKLTLNAEVAYKFSRQADAHKRLYINAGAAYAHELFTASAVVAMEKPYDQDAIFGATVGATSTTLVKGAELSAKARFNLNKIAKLDTDKTNDLTFACKVSF